MHNPVDVAEITFGEFYGDSLDGSAECKRRRNGLVELSTEYSGDACLQCTSGLLCWQEAKVAKRLGKLPLMGFLNMV
jgi:hypothetical protein